MWNTLLPLKWKPSTKSITWCIFGSGAEYYLIFQVIIVEQADPTKDDILNKISGVDAILWSSKYNLDLEVIEKTGPQLKCVGVMSAGYDYVDVAELIRRNVKVGHAPKVFTTAVAEVAIFLALAVAKRSTEGRRIIENGTWSFGPQWMLGRELRGSTVGIIGLGGLGLELADYLKAFKVSQILYTAHRERPEAAKYNAKFVSFHELISRSDYVFPCVPLTEETRGMFHSAVFAKMKPTAIFVNISRGGIVIQDDLIEALQKRTIFGAGLDVMTPEPLPADHELLKLDNVVLLPHVGSATYRSRLDTAILTAQNIIAGLNGKVMPAPVKL